MTRKNLVITVSVIIAFFLLLGCGLWAYASSSAPVSTTLPKTEYSKLENQLLSLGLYKNSDGQISGELTLNDGTFARVTGLNKDGSLSLVKQEAKGRTRYIRSKASYMKVRAFLSRMEAVNR